MDEFEARGVRVAAISVDSQEKTEELKQKAGYTFTFLCDTDTKVIRQWNILHPGGGPGGADIARPAEFLIDPSGVIRWVNLTPDYRDRVHAPAVLKELNKLGVTAQAAKP